MEARVVMATAGTVALAVGAQQHPASVKTAGEHVVHNISQRRGACYRRIPQTPQTRTDRLVDPRTAGADTTQNENACYNYGNPVRAALPTCGTCVTVLAGAHTTSTFT